VSDTEAEVLISVHGRWGPITLNRPRALSALTYPMCCTIDDTLAAWARDDAIIGVLIGGVGKRGFCAGGDIRALYETACAGDVDPVAIFLRVNAGSMRALRAFRNPMPP